MTVIKKTSKTKFLEQEIKTLTKKLTIYFNSLNKYFYYKIWSQLLH